MLARRRRTLVGSGEIPIEEDEWEESEPPIEEELIESNSSPSARGGRRRSSLICPIYNDPISYGLPRPSPPAHPRSRVTRHTQTERHVPKGRQLLYCLMGDDEYRRQRQRAAAQAARASRHVNSVSHIDRAARVFFPASFGLLNVLYWLAYYKYQEDFRWKDPINSLKS